MLTQPQIQSLTEMKQSAIRWIASQGLGLPEAEDIFQQAVLKAVTTESDVNDSSKIGSWFYSVLRTTLIDEFRRQAAQEKKTRNYALEVLPALDSQTEQKLCNCLEHFIEELPEKERDLLHQHFFQGRTFKELSEQSGQSESAVRVRALRARKKLKEAFRTFCGMKSLSESQECEC